MGLSADFGADSVDELQIGYKIAVTRDYETEILNSDCETKITGIDVLLTNAVRTDRNAAYDTLALSYDFDKSSITSSSIWDAESNQIEVCQIVRLIIPQNDSDPKMVITEDKRTLTMNFDLNVDFELDNDLGAGATKTGSGLANVDNYVEAFKCTGDQFTPDPSPLLPNNDLIVCVRSVDADVQIDSLDSMVSSIYIVSLLFSLQHAITNVSSHYLVSRHADHNPGRNYPYPN